MFSDDTAAQFKQKFLILKLTFIKEEYNIDELQWHFFATSHDKGATDGVGGTIKRLVWSQVLIRKDVVCDANPFMTVPELLQYK